MKRITLSFIGIILLLVACGEDSNDSASKGKSQSSAPKETQATDVNYDDFIGDTIDIADNGSITLPLETQVVDVVYSGDGQVKLFNTQGEMILVNGEEIVHIEEAGSTYTLPAVSEDGRFAAWFADYDDSGVSFYDLENSRFDVIERDDVPHDLHIEDDMMIEKLDDSYFYVSNTKQHEFPPLSALELVTQEPYTESNDDHIATLDKLGGDEPVLDSDRYHDFDEQARIILDPISEKWMYTYEDAGYYQLVFNFENDSENDFITYAINLYGFNAHRDSVIPVEIVTDEFDLGEDGSRIRNEDMRIADKTGLVLVPMFEADGDDMSHFAVYYTDLSQSDPKLSLVIEEELDGDVRDRPRAVVSSSGDGFYLARKDGTLTFFDLAE